MSFVDLEVCISSDTVDFSRSVVAAFEGGADRIELCSSMSVGGLTPSREQIRTARDLFAGRNGLMVMIRLSDDGFVLNPDDVATVTSHIEMAAEEKADGVVLGFLTPDGAIDVNHTRSFSALAHHLGLQVTFHRAIDAARDFPEALEDVVACGVDRVLVSGIPWGTKGTLMDGLPQLYTLIERSRGRVEIILAGGISAENVQNVTHLMKIPEARLSVHAFSGVRCGGATDRNRVIALKNRLSFE